MNSLFITHEQPLKKPSRDTIHRRTLELLNKCGINAVVYTTHSAKHA